MILSGPWRFQPDPAAEGVTGGFFKPDYDTRRWREVNLPASFEGCMPALNGYEGEGWFRTTFTVPADRRGRRIALRFEGVNYHSSVWVNGRLVGGSEDGFLPFELDVHDVLRWGEENILVVRADNLRRKGEVPGMQRAWLPLGGILRDVELIETDKLRLGHVSVVAEPAGAGGRLAVQAQIMNQRADRAEVALAISLTRDAQNISRFTSPGAPCAGGGSAQLSAAGAVPGVEPWSPDRPTLYTLSVELRAGGQVVDQRSIRVGFRKIEVRDSRLFLNGRPLFVTGFNRHEDSPLTGMCPDPATTRQDLLDMKAAGCNFIRLCHYPHHTGELDLCDELGLLAMGEIPLFWWDGLAEGEENYANKIIAAQRQLTAMIRRDINHPCLIFWSVSNETHEQRAEVVPGNTALVKLARELDPTRLATFASNHWQPGQVAESVADGAQFEANDVICVNAYPALNERGYGGKHDYDFAQATAFWRRGLAQLHEKYPGKPIVVSEFGYAGMEGVFGTAFGEDTQAQAIAHEFAGMDAPYVCGAVIWCWADHVRSQTGFCRNLIISPYGVLTRERRKLQAYWTVQKIFRERQAAGPRQASLAPAATVPDEVITNAFVSDVTLAGERDEAGLP